jgi:DTW domain-containing protein
MCDAITPFRNAVMVVVVMHKRESTKTSNTGRLAVAALERASLHVRGTTFPMPAPLLPPGKVLALFPDEGARVLGPHDRGSASALIVPDGNWSQARRILKREPFAREAEVVRLPPGPPSRYAVRRTPHEGTVCTFEAIVRALSILEGPEVEESLTPLLERFVGRALVARGRHGGGL